VTTTVNLELDELRAVVRRLTDREEVAGLLLRLTTCLDEGAYDDMRKVLAEDVTVRTPGGEAVGVEAAVGQASRNHSAAVTVQHLIGEVLVGLDVDEAVLRANAIITFVGGPGGGRELREVYRCRARRTPAGWRIVRLETSVVRRQPVSD
jgi:hypothetical protein